jgi:hypothetical protein
MLHGKSFASMEISALKTETPYDVGKKSIICMSIWKRKILCLGAVIF